jgi:hypothetical protein
MFSYRKHRHLQHLAFVDTRAMGSETVMAMPFDGFGEVLPLDPLEQMSRADAADWTLLRLVLCAAAATLALAVAASLGL